MGDASKDTRKRQMARLEGAQPPALRVAMLRAQSRAYQGVAIESQDAK